ncbi:membrane dipeptidase [Thermococcus sp. GR7]|uniref:dipeptidase n=1 Tax=unclassified Thermococcus TaxID=2627626 RepID=UPI00142F7DC5|nr:MULTISPECIES: dipeptidase [unclassified Thermococcus]NJE46637.1 membrane dipeptidase [Thermococcus sp. GR7]NJE77935.1 membrane dipeptidase [Thermococcus sp. GR4]NJF23063.1 membrane dipeptidase [Thermococcus sp. GR5]
MIFDAHSDLPAFVYDERKKGKTLVLEESFNQFFAPGVAARVMAIWTKPDRRSSALRYGLEVLNALQKDVAESERFELVKSVKDMRKAIEEGRVALWLGLEGGEPIEDSLDLLEVFHHLGLRVLTLTWSLRNAIGDGVFERTNGGLTNFGVEVVGKAEELGIIIDLSHINEAGFWDALDVTAFPVMASHSNARALCDHPRNLTDEQIKAIAERDGVIGAVAIPSFVDREKPTLEKYVDHIAYMAELAGYKHVGLGFDFVYYLSGWSGRSVEGFEDESKIPALLERLNENFSAKEVRAITFRNLERLFERVIG